MNYMGLFEHSENQLPKVNTRVVVKTERGLELGYIIGQAGCYRSAHFRLNEEQIKGYYETSECEVPALATGQFVRFASAEDISEEKHLSKIAVDEIKCCKRVVKELKLSMKIIDAEHIFGGERIIFYFMADGRVDFRDLVKQLAQDYQTRIELRQIGSRDEAKLLGDVETCGQECCCKRFLNGLKPVNMRMAKMQKATLDPSKISGYCGRLKCCLRYEDETYTELKKRLPRKGVRVRTPEGEGRVIDGQILTQLVMVEKADQTRIAVKVDDLTIIDESAQGDSKPEEANGGGNGNGEEGKDKQ